MSNRFSRSGDPSLRIWKTRPDVPSAKPGLGMPSPRGLRRSAPAGFAMHNGYGRGLSPAQGLQATVDTADGAG